jgi:hypothetical protein
MPDVVFHTNKETIMPVFLIASGSCFSDSQFCYAGLNTRRRSVALFVKMILVLVIFGAGHSAYATPKKTDTRTLIPHSIKVKATPIVFDRQNPERRKFGRLLWRGGVKLQSKSRHFGGYSGLTLDPTGTRMLSVSDAGSWLMAEIDYEGNHIVGLKNARIGSLLKSPIKKWWWRKHCDAESIVETNPNRGVFYISFEHKHRIEKYVLRKGVLRGPLKRLRLPPNLRRMHRNSGLEAIGILRGGRYKGAFVAFAETLLDRRGNHTGAIVVRGKPYPLYLTRTDNFDITEIKSLKDGSLLVLERSFVKRNLHLEMRLRLIPAREIRPGALLSGEVLFRAGTEMQIDNMEGLAVHEGPKGESLITLISDDNFNFFQRTLLLQFELNEHRMSGDNN